MAGEVKPVGLLGAHLEYLDDLRETGTLNMFGAAPYLTVRFPDLTRAQARAILQYWMETFDERNPT